MQLDDLAGVHRETPPLQWGRRPRLALIALTASCALQLSAAVLAHETWRLRFVVSYTGLVAAGLVLQSRRPRQTRLTAQALVVRTSVFTQRAVAWQDVTGIRVQGRWDTGSTAVVRGGPPLPLPGLPRGQAERLARVVAGEPPAPAALPGGGAAPRHPAAPARGVSHRSAAPDDLEMEAGFRRGRRRSGS